MTKLDLHTIQKIFKKRLPASHKGNHGHALIIAGSKSKMGAAIIAARSCLRAGAGLVSVNIPRKERSIVFTAIPEAMVEFREEGKNWSKYNSFAIGPGIGTGKQEEKLVTLLMTNVNSPIVFDADALNILAKNNGWLSQIKPGAVLTPHVKEFDRLFGNHESDSDRRLTAKTKAAELDIIIVLKGHKTFITDGKETFENTTGNPGLAKGGSGDALTGIITALLAQGYDSLNASKLGVFLHGLAADITLETQSEESMLITDVIENIGKAFQQI